MKRNSLLLILLITGVFCFTSCANVLNLAFGVYGNGAVEIEVYHLNSDYDLVIPASSSFPPLVSIYQTASNQAAKKYSLSSRGTVIPREDPRIEYKYHTETRTNHVSKKVSAIAEAYSSKTLNPKVKAYVTDSCQSNEDATYSRTTPDSYYNGKYYWVEINYRWYNLGITR